MEDLGDILRRLGTRDTSADNPYADRPAPEDDVEVHEVCGGRGWLTSDVPVGHPEFGRVLLCECQEARVREDRYSRLLRYSNLGHMARFSFENLKPEGLSDDPESRRTFEAAYRAALEYADMPGGWLAFSGPHGSGKTHLAAAIGNRCIQHGRAVFFANIPDLLDHLRGTFSPTSELPYTDLFEQVQNTPLLVLDGLDLQGTSAWAEEKLRQIVNHRYNADLPTVFTTAVPLDELDSYIVSRMRTAEGSRILELPSQQQDRPERLGRIEPELLHRMTFESFDVRGNNPSASQRSSLEGAFQAAQNFAADPDGWLALYGDTGVGKTHLAVAIAAERLGKGEPAFFVTVPDLLDYLRFTYSPESTITYDDVFEEVKTTPLLILDDLGREHSTPWAVEKLYQIVVHRHNARAATVFTAVRDLGDRRDPIASRVKDPSISQEVPIDAPDYRDKRPSGRARRRPRARG